jgi:hypothetical protein
MFPNVLELLLLTAFYCCAGRCLPLQRAPAVGDVLRPRADLQAHLCGHAIDIYCHSCGLLAGGIRAD